MIIDLRGCTVEVAVYYTKRKHVLRLSTFNGLCEYLMQCEDNNDMVLWLDTFLQVLSNGRDSMKISNEIFFFFFFQEQTAANNSDKEDGPLSSYSSSEMMLVRQAHEADNSMAHGRLGYSLVSKTRKPSLPGVGGYSEPTLSTPTNAKSTRKVVQQFKKIQGSSFVQFFLVPSANGAGRSDYRRSARVLPALFPVGEHSTHRRALRRHRRSQGAGKRRRLPSPRQQRGRQRPDGLAQSRIRRPQPVGPALE